MQITSTRERVMASGRENPGNQTQPSEGYAETAVVKHHEPIDSGAATYRPSMAMRLWRALGFRHAWAPRPDDDDAHYLINRTVTCWCWRDRLRILVSGKTEVEVCITAADPIFSLREEARATVLAPGSTA